MNWAAVVWLALIVVFLLIEASTVTLVSTWFAVGALAALIAGLLNAPVWLQVMVFVLISAAALSALRPLVRKYVTPKITKTNVDAVVGSTGLVTVAIDNVSAVLSTEDLAPNLYAVLGEIKKECEPDTLEVYDQIAVVAAVGRKMAFRPGISGKIFATLGEAGVNIRMINQGPDELNIIFGVDNHDFEKAIGVLYNSFVK